LGALYTFTPFKLIYTATLSQQRDSNVILFWYPRGTIGFYHEKASEVSSYSLPEAIKKCRRLGELWRVPLRDKIRDSIYLYSEFPAVEFSPSSDKYVLIIDRNLYEYFTGRKSEEEIKKVLERRVRRSTFLLAEFSYRSINEPNFCRLGLVLITHRAECPIASLCPLRGSQSTGRCRHFLTWRSTRETYAGLYKVTAELGIEVVELERQTSKVVKQLLVVPYKGRPLFEITFVDPVNVLAYYRGVNFIPKKYVERMLRAVFAKTLGVKLYMTSALRISFIDSVLEGLVEDILSKEDVKRWLRFKAGLLLLSKALPGTSSKRAPLKPWIRLKKILCGPGKLDQNLLNEALNRPDEELQDAVKFIVVHTIAHMVLMNLWSFLGLSENEISYVITHNPSDSQYYVWIFEAASGGYGYLRYLAEHRDRLYEILTLAFTKVKGDVCTTEVNPDVIKSLEDAISNLEKELSAGRGDSVERVCKKLRTFLNNSMELYKLYGVTPHVYTVYSCVADIVPGALRESFSRVVDKLHTIFHGFDGVIGYYYLEEGCSMGPFLQPFSVSCSATRVLAEGVDLSEIRERLKKYIITWIGRARSSLKVITWVISIHDFDELLKALRRVSERGAKIQILLGEGAINDDNSIKSVEKLYEELSKKAPGTVEVRVYTQRPLHKKLIIVDDIVLIEGSFNLTKSALTKNIESAHIYTDPRYVEKSLKEFDSLWNSAKPVKSGSDLRTPS
jgi:HKD family nuclease